jgi:hypothetical protein
VKKVRHKFEVMDCIFMTARDRVLFVRFVLSLIGTAPQGTDTARLYSSL